jgi:hypothetical protein
MLYPGKAVLPPGKSLSSRATILVHASSRAAAEDHPVRLSEIRLEPLSES